MDTDRFQLITPTHPSYRDLVRGLTKEVWPEFMLHDQIANKLWHELLDRFAEYQLALYDIQNQRVAGMANSFSLKWDEPLENLPEGGWDWAFLKAVEDSSQGLAPNLQCAIQIIVRPDYQGRGFSGQMVEAVRALTKFKGLHSLIIPIRPSEKNKYPLTSLDDYVTWETRQSLPFDSWLRVHVRAGGKIIKVCHESKLIRGSQAEWEQWTGLQFPQSGRYIIEGALNPMQMNVENDEGIYVEPNVWMVHEIR
jgi:GNAT superfamily N-acetyltransferase